MSNWDSWGGEEKLDLVFPRGDLHIVAGCAGAGKTGWLVGQVGGWKKEGRFLGYEAPVPPIYYVVYDHPWADYEYWFGKVGVDEPPHYSACDVVTDDDSDLDSRRADGPVKYLQKCIAQITPKIEPGAVVVCEPGALYIGGDLHKYIPVARGMKKLTRLAKNHNWTMILSLHSPKITRDEGMRYYRAEDRIIGSGALRGGAGTVMHIAIPQECESDQWHELSISPRHAPPMLFKMSRDTNGVLRKVSEMEVEKVMSEREGLILSLVPGGGVRIDRGLLVKKIIAAGVSKSDAYRKLEGLEKSGQVQRSGGNCTRVDIEGEKN